MTSPAPLILYLSVPFCPKPCAYCTRRTLDAGGSQLRYAYADALQRELEASAPDFQDAPVEAVWVGGGIAAHMFDDALGALLKRLPRLMPVAPDAEITITAHPGMVSVETLNACRRGGVSRLNLDFATANPAEYRRLGRFLDPSALDVTMTVLGSSALSLGFDLVVGIEGQTDESLRRSIDHVLKRGARHLSLFPLERGDGRDGDSDAARAAWLETRAELLGFATALLTARGFTQYAPHRFAVAGEASRYLALEHAGANVLGLGLGARTRLDGVCSVNTDDLGRYLAHTGDPSTYIARVEAC